MTPGQGDDSDGRARIFLSWSGEPSRLLATALSGYIEGLSDRLDPWLSEDLQPGAEWASTLIPQIRKARLAILCLTRRNVTAPWIAFETGAYYSSRLKKGVIPFLLDLPSSELTFPLGLFQGLQADRAGSKALFLSVGKLSGMDVEAIEQWFLEHWPRLREELDDIRREGSRREEPGNWLNVANAFYLGHDLRWTIDVINGGGSAQHVVHGLRQILHQADELGLSQHNDYVVLRAQVTKASQLSAHEWTPEVRIELEESVKTALERFGELVRRRQPTYRPYASDNRENWLAIQAERGA
jgi:hypothetical protein